MADYKPAGCEVFDPKRKTPAPPKPPAPGNLPEQLTRDAITAGLGTISVAGCNGKSSARGEVHVSIAVSPEGRVAGVTIRAQPDDVLGACVSAAAARGTFARTQRGGTFKYVWRF
jgi:hypothetical protein